MRTNYYLDGLGVLIIQVILLLWVYDVGTIQYLTTIGLMILYSFFMVKSNVGEKKVSKKKKNTLKGG